MKAQEIYNKVLTHLRAQKRAAMNSNGCAYRGRKHQGVKTMCAVGCLIPDELYNPEIEGRSVDAYTMPSDEAGIALRKVLRSIGIVKSQIGLLDALQKAHDIVLADYGMDAWEVKMEAIAHNHKLKYTPAP